MKKGKIERSNKTTKKKTATLECVREREERKSGKEEDVDEEVKEEVVV